MDFSSHQNDRKKFELNNKTIALNILFVSYNTEKVRLAYKSKYNFKRENQVILLLITDCKKMALSCCKNLVCIAYKNNIKS